MKQCPKCDTKHDKTGVYCSRACANSRKFTAEARAHKSISGKKFWSGLSDEDRATKISVMKEHHLLAPANYMEQLLVQDWDVIGIQGKRLRVILEQNGCCNKCGLSEWLSEPLVLEYEHKDGNNSNNDRSNVEALCPNCHSQTPTWRGRKNKKTQERIEYYIDIKNTPP